MKIGITSTHGCWKTTLLKALPDGLVDRKITEVSRTLIEKMGFNPLLWESPYWKKRDFEKNILEEQKRQELLPGSFVTDRTVYDVLAYASTLLEPLDFWPLYHDAVSFNKKNPYDIVFYLPVEFPMENDGVRPVNEDYRREINLIIEDLLIQNEIPYVKVTGTIEERVSQVCREIERVQAMR